MKKLFLTLFFISMNFALNVKAWDYSFKNNTDKDLIVIADYGMQAGDLDTFPEKVSLSPRGTAGQPDQGIWHKRTGDMELITSQDSFTINSGDICAKEFQVYHWKDRIDAIFTLKPKAPEKEFCRSVNLVIEDDPASSDGLIIKEQ